MCLKCLNLIGSRMTRGEETVKQLEAGNDINDPPCVLMRPEYIQHIAGYRPTCTQCGDPAGYLPKRDGEVTEPVHVWSSGGYRIWADRRKAGPEPINNRCRR